MERSALMGKTFRVARRQLMINEGIALIKKSLLIQRIILTYVIMEQFRI